MRLVQTTIAILACPNCRGVEWGAVRRRASPMGYDQYPCRKCGHIISAGGMASLQQSIDIDEVDE